MEEVADRPDFPGLINPILWARDREVVNDSWCSPAGNRIISVDNHGMEGAGPWEKCLTGDVKAHATKLWQREDTLFQLGVERQSYNFPVLDSGLAEGRSGMWNRDQRLKDMDAEKVDTSLIPQARSMSLVRMSDMVFFTRCMDAYNEWLDEYCSVAPKRPVGVGIFPTIYNPQDSADYIAQTKAWSLKALQIASAARASAITPGN